MAILIYCSPALFGIVIVLGAISLKKAYLKTQSDYSESDKVNFDFKVNEAYWVAALTTIVSYGLIFFAYTPNNQINIVHKEQVMTYEHEIKKFKAAREKLTEQLRLCDEENQVYRNALQKNYEAN